jgi:hypothetical protein
MPFEVILEQKPGALGIAAGSKGAKQILALAHGGFGIRKLAPQIGECSVGF